MAGRKKILASILILFSLVSLCFSQNTDNSAYYITEDEEGNQVVHQKFSWDKSDDVLKYVFVMEQKGKNDEYKQIIKEETKVNSIETSLQAGQYRYKIFVYNFLGLIEIETDWIHIDIIKAYQPKITGVSPGLIYIEEEQNGIFNVDGGDLTENTLFSLSTSHKNADGKYVAEIVEVNKNNRHVKIHFNPDELDTGNYSLIATNPGGLRVFYDSVVIKWKKPIDFDVSLGYSPLYVVYDDTFEDFFGSSFVPVAANLRMSFIPLKRKTYSFGIGLSNYAGYINNKTDAYEVSSYLALTNLQFIYQHYLYKRKIMLDIHAGPGLTFLVDSKFNYPMNITSKPFNSFYINVNAGLTLQTYFTKRFYAELNVDYQHTFLSDMMFGSIQPSLSFGYQF